MVAARLRRRSRIERKTDFIVPPSRDSHCALDLPDSVQIAGFRLLSKPHSAGSPVAILSRIAHSQNLMRHGDKRASDQGPTEVSTLDQLFRGGWAMMVPETSTSSLSFRSSELSQPI
jgi:hypothetical protein